MSGKGDRPRPYSVDQKTFESNWENMSLTNLFCML
jgi:hypothetical protein